MFVLIWRHWPSKLVYYEESTGSAVCDLFIITVIVCVIVLVDVPGNHSDGSEETDCLSCHG